MDKDNDGFVTYAEYRTSETTDGDADADTDTDGER